MAFLLLAYLHTALLLVSLLSSSHATPLSPKSTHNDPPLASGASLRVLPIGDSITYGWGAADKTGYRSRLHKALSRTNDVKFIGRIKHGYMDNNECECHPGFAIGHIMAKAPPSLEKRPNVILLMAGTNDIVLNLNVPKMGEVMGSMLDLIHDTCPDAVVLVSTIPPILREEMDRKRLKYNREVLPKLIKERAGEGEHVQLLQLELGKKDINKTDSVHPISEAYKIIADMWLDGIRDVDRKGWIKAPVVVPKKPESWMKPVRRIVGVTSKTQFAGIALVIGAITFAVWRTVVVARLLLKR